MIIKRNRKLIIPALAILILSMVVPAGTQKSKSERSFKKVWGPNYSAQTVTPSIPDQQIAPGTDELLRWNRISIDASGLDHTPVAPGENRVFGEQVGPCRAARAIAIVHIAMFEAVDMIVGGFRSYVGLSRKSGPASTDAAVAQAAHDTLVVLFPSQKTTFDNRLAEDLSQIADGQQKVNGIAFGRRAAAAILALRAADGSQHAEPRVGIDFITSNDAGKWRQDPISHHPLALGAHWGDVTPFVLVSSSQYRVRPVPAMNSPEYTAAFNEVKRLGGDGIHTPTERTAEQTIISTFWAYDGTPSLCAPPRL